MSAPAQAATAVDALTIADALGQPRPTDEQREVIEAPLAPLLVVAGAGSGKTETMAARVVWLVANGLVQPDQVLGLTFTRKAAGELAERVRKRLRRLRASGLWSPPDGEDEVGEPTVSTYHAYAGRLVGEHALRLGVEPQSRLLTEAASWQYASEVVERWDGDMSSVTHAASSVTEAVVSLAGECAEHLVDPADLETFLDETVVRVEALPHTGRSPLHTKVKPVLAALKARRQVVPLVRAYVELKRVREALDFGDQVALAATLSRDVPEIGAAERGRFAAVLLDEYQDTSHAQLVMLHALFGGGHGVTAVGDPHQSIYGWRGASAGTLERFAEVFRDADGEPARVAPLSTSWRNDRSILDAANVVAGRLPQGRRVQVRRLVPRPGAEEGAVALAAWETTEDEAGGVADWVAHRWWDGDGRPTGVSAAVLCRKRSQFELLETALRERGLPVEVVGLGGLLTTPEVADLVAALHVVHDPGRGDMLVRLLTGPLVRLGPRDLVGLAAWSRAAQRHAAAGRDGEADDPDAPDDSDAVAGSGDTAAVDDPLLPDAVDEASIVEALDTLPRKGWRDRDGRGLSDAGRDRLQALGDLLRGLRSRTALPLPELVGEVERALRLDVEVAARPDVPAHAARAHLEAFAEVAAGFAATADHATLGAFLAWLDAAETRERGLEPGRTDVSRDAVQLLTVHAAKGLEWDVVVVPGLVECTFPATEAKVSADGDGWKLSPDRDKGWLSGLDGLPSPLRGDSDALPALGLEECADQGDLADAIERLTDRSGSHAVAEERRLAYVALTRARSELLMTAHVWGSATTPRLLSRFVRELVDDPGVGPRIRRGPWAEPPPAPAQNPRADEVRTAPWPADPLGRRRVAVEAGARRVRAALTALGADRPDDGPTPARSDDVRRDAPPAAPPGDEADDAARWAWEVRALLAERDRLDRPGQEVVLPTHVSASRLVALARDPQAVAMDLRRPMPSRPSPAARRGTAFHAWVEQRLGRAAIVDVLELPGAADDDPAPDAELARLQASFLASEWADAPVVDVEVPVETPVAGTVVRGRLDAVFRRGDGGYDVVDWKTGPAPTGAAARARAVQLAAYRLAWSRLTGTPVEQVGAAFFYAATGETVRPVDLLDEAALEAMLREVPELVEPGEDSP